MSEGTMYSYGLSWHRQPGDTTSVSLGPYSDQEQGEQEFAQALTTMGYSKPKWWQYWRWGENRPSDRVLERLRTKDA
jgi:hypothetical protein